MPAVFPGRRRRPAAAPAPLIAVLISALLLLGCPAGRGAAPGTAPSPPPAAAPAAVRPEPGAEVEGLLGPGGTLHHPIPLEEGDYLQVHVDRPTSEVRTRLLAPGPADGPGAAVGWGELSADPPGQTRWAIASQGGTHRVEVVADGEGGPVAYRLEVLALHPAGPEEADLQAGMEAWEAGLRAQGAGRHEEATALLEAAHQHWSAAEYLRGVAASLVKLGRSLRALGHLERAAEVLERSFETWMRAGDPVAAAGALNLLGTVEIDRHRWSAAGETLAEALRLARAKRAPEHQGHALEAVCRLYVRRGETGKALAACRRALGHWESLGRSIEAVDSLLVLGLLHRRLGDLDEARRLYLEALGRLEGGEELQREATIYNNLATLHDLQGELQDALVDYQRALELRERARNRAGTALVLFNMGSVKERIGDLDDTLRLYRRAREIQEEIGDVEGLVTTLFGIGWVHLHRERPDLAREPLERALALSRESGAGPLLATALEGIAELRLAEAKPEEALDALDEALRIERESGNRWNQTRLLALVADAERELGRGERALDALREAAAINEEIGNRRGLATNHYEMARLLRGADALEEARAAVERALRVADLLRQRVGGRELRSRVGASHQRYFELLIDILMEQHARDPGAGRDAEAFREAERARALSLLEVLAGADLGLARRVPEELRTERSRLRSLLEELEGRRNRLIREAESGDAAPELFRVELELDRVLIGLAEVERRMREADPRYALLTRPRPVGVPEVRRWVTDPGTVLLEYRLGAERSFLFVVGPEGLQAFELAGRQVLEQEARCLHRLVTAFGDPGKPADEDLQPCLGPRGEGFEDPGGASPIERRHRRRGAIEAAYRERSARLTELLLGEAHGSGVLAGRRLAVVADGALVYVPFAALPDPCDRGRTLLGHHEVVHLPSASVLALHRRRAEGDRTPSKRLAVIADPIYSPNDPRVAAGSVAPRTEAPWEGHPPGASAAHPGAAFPRLPFSAEEARAIAALVEPEESFLALGSDARREVVSGASLAGFRYVHFATHGVLDTEYPQLSGLVLSLVDRSGSPRDNGFLRLEDVYDMRLDADMVVLSACDTALGREVRGEGLVGLARGFMHAGARRVVASLWRAHDVTTADLMERFYRGLLLEGRPPADALRQAQLGLVSDPRGDFHFPYYWAGFTLQGDWR